jgi:chaperonin GroEL (HSP60 family)
MASKHLLFRADARTKILRGVTALADAVRITLGPKSKSVLIAKKWGVPLVCNDGVTIAKELELEDLTEAGIIDPTKVVRIGLENAVSVAGVLLLSEATMTDNPEPKLKESTAGLE